MSGFTLGGGTALAEFYLGHRLSQDFDLFTNQPDLVRTVGPAVPQILKRCDGALEATVLGTHSLQWRFQVINSNTEESSLLEIANAEPPYREDPLDVGGVRVASFEDLVLGKLVALTDRTEAKDLADLWAIAEATDLDFPTLESRLIQQDPRFLVSPDRLARGLQRAATALDSLVFPPMLKAIDKAKLKAFLEAEARSAAGRLGRD